MRSNQSQSLACMPVTVPHTHTQALVAKWPIAMSTFNQPLNLDARSRLPKQRKKLTEQTQLPQWQSAWALAGSSEIGSRTHRDNGLVRSTRKTYFPSRSTAVMPRGSPARVERVSRSSRLDVRVSRHIGQSVRTDLVSVITSQTWIGIPSDSVKIRFLASFGGSRRPRIGRVQIDADLETGGDP
jgi:hypothetical protein